MNKKLTLLLLMAMPVVLLSCKQCYECEEYEYCMDCDYTISGTTYNVDACYSTPEAREAAIEEFEDAYSSFGSATCTRSQQKAFGGDVEEVCEKKKDAEERVDDLEDFGYVCTEQ